jgi:hypothetical protein
LLVSTALFELCLYGLYLPRVAPTWHQDFHPWLDSLLTFHLPQGLLCLSLFSSALPPTSSAQLSLSLLGLSGSLCLPPGILHLAFLHSPLPPCRGYQGESVWGWSGGRSQAAGEWKEPPPLSEGEPVGLCRLSPPAEGIVVGSGLGLGTEGPVGLGGGGTSRRSLPPLS